MSIQSTRSRRRAILSIFLVLVVNASGIGLVMPQLGPMLFSHATGSLLPVATSDYARHWYYGIALSLPVIFMFLGSPFWGAISDSIGRKKVLTIAICGQIAAMLMASYGINFQLIALFLFAQAFIGLIDASESTAQAAMVDISQPHTDKIKNISLVSLAFTLGFIIGPILGGILSDKTVVSWFSYETPFLVAAGLSFINLLVLLVCFKETYHVDKEKRPRIRESILELFVIFKNKKVLNLATIFLCMQIAWALFFQSLSLTLMTWFGYTPKDIGFFMVAVSFAFSISLLVILRLLLRFLSQKTIICFGFLLALITPLIDIFYAKELWIWFSIFPITLGIALIYNTLLGCLSNLVTDHQQGRIMGLSLTVSATAFALSAILIGLFATFSLKIIFAIMAFSLLSGFFLMLLKKL